MNKKESAIKTSLLLIVVALIGLIVLMFALKPAPKEEPEGIEAAVPISTLVVVPTNTADLVILPAIIEANVNATLSAEKPGRVIELKVDRGDLVEKGQLLLQIDDRIWQANLKQANIQAKEAVRNRERFEKLRDSGAVADSEFDRVETAAIRAEAMATEALINIEQCRVVSPVTGVVNDRFIDEGEYVQPGTPVFQVVDKATVKVIILIPEKDIFAIHKDDEIEFSIQPLAGKMFTGIVTFVAARADSRNNSFRAEITVDNAENLLRPGMIAQTRFVRGVNENMISLPMSAVLPSKGDHIVYLAKDGQAVRRTVRIETITRERALISEGLEAGDIVIVEGNRALNDGQRVEVIEMEPAK